MLANKNKTKILVVVVAVLYNISVVRYKYSVYPIFINKSTLCFGRSALQNWFITLLCSLSLFIYYIYRTNVGRHQRFNIHFLHKALWLFLLKVQQQHDESIHNENNEGCSAIVFDIYFRLLSSSCGITPRQEWWWQQKQQQCFFER